MNIVSIVFSSVFLTSLCIHGKFDFTVEEDLPDVLSIIQTVRTAAFPQCQQAVYFQPSWTAVANIVRLSSSDPIVLVDSNLTRGSSTKIPVVKKPPGATSQGTAKPEWCVGWILLVDNLEHLEMIIDMIRFANIVNIDLV